MSNHPNSSLGFSRFLLLILFSSLLVSLALKHFTQLKYFLYYIFLTLNHLFLYNNKIHAVVTHFIMFACLFKNLSLFVYFFLNLCHRGYSVLPPRRGFGTPMSHVLQVAEKQNKARTMVITRKRRIQNVPK